MKIWLLHNTVIGNCDIRNLFMHPNANGLTNLTEIWNQNFSGHDASFKFKTPFGEIKPRCVLFTIVGIYSQSHVLTFLFLLENLKILSLGRNNIKNLNGLVSTLLLSSVLWGGGWGIECQKVCVHNRFIADNALLKW